MKLNNFIQIITIILLTGLLFYCKSKPATITESLPVKEERLSVVRALEIIRNAVVHSEKYLEEVQAEIVYVAYLKGSYKDTRAAFIRIDSMIAVGKERCWRSLQFLEKVAEPDSIISYKGRAKKIVQRVYDIYQTDYRDVVNVLKWSNDSLPPEMKLKMSNPVWEMLFPMANLDNAAQWIRERHNIPRKEREYNFIPKKKREYNFEDDFDGSR